MPLDWERLRARRTHRMRPSAVRDILRVSAAPDLISFAGGLPAPELFPVGEYRAAFDQVMATDGRMALQYGVTEGHEPLRRLIAERVAHGGPPVDPERVLITNGSQQTLDLMGKVLLDPGDILVLERPSYLGAIQAFDQYEAEYALVAADDDGMDIEGLRRALESAASRPKLIYCQPNFQNPTGRTLAADRRPLLVALAAEFGIPILEDDPYGELRFEGEPAPSLMVLDRDGMVFQTGTFSKILAPGLRLGWLVAPTPEAARSLVLAKQPSDLHTSTATQMAVHRLMCADGFLERHLGRLRDCYRERRDAMATAVDEDFPVGTRRTHPAGGLFLWVELPGEVDTAELLLRALPRHVAFVPGRPFHADGSGAACLRLTFATVSPERIRDGIGRLGRVIEEGAYSPA